MSPASLTDTSSTKASTTASRSTTSRLASSRSIYPSSSISVPSSSKLSSAQNPGESSSIRSAAGPGTTTSQSYVELSTRPTTTATTTVSRGAGTTSGLSSSQTLSASASTSSSRTNSATSSGNISVVQSSTSTSAMSSSSSASASAPSISTLSPNATPSTTGHASNGSPSPTTITIISSPTGTRTSIQSTSSMEPTTTPEPTMTSDPDPGVTPIYPPVVHKVVIDSGTCADLGKPKVVSTAVGLSRELTSLGGNRYSVVLDFNERETREVRVFLEDASERCGSYGVCASIFITLDPTTLTLAVARSGDRGLTMFPFSFWTDGGKLFDGTPADSQADKYNCWGWPAPDCPFSSTYPNDPEYALTSTTPNATIYITFCPPDGPPASSVGLNPNPPDDPPQPAVTNVVLSTGTTVLVSTFVHAVTSSQPQHGLTPVTRTPAATLTELGSIMSVSVPTASPDPASQSFLHPLCSTGMTCIQLNTLLPIEETTTVPIGTPFLVTKLTTTTSGVEPISTVPVIQLTLKGEPTVLFSTYINIGTTSIVPVTNVTPTPTRPRGGNGALPTVTSWIVMHTDSVHSKTTSDWEVSTLPGSDPSLVTVTDPLTTSTLGAQVIPTFSTITDSRGSAVTTVPYNLTTAPPPAPTPPPETLYTLTSWTTWLTVNGSTVPVIAGQVGVLTTIPVTYVLEPDTTIPVGALSSISVESTRTSLPSVTAQAKQDRVAPGNQSKVAGAVVGSLVGATLLGVLLWVVCLRRKRRRHTPDYAAHHSPMWGSGSGYAEGSGEGSELDLDSEPRPRESFVEPWVDQSRPQGESTSRKMQREMGEYGQGPSQSRDTTGASSSVGLGYNALRSGKSANRVPPELRPEPLDHWPARNDTLSSIRSQGSSSGHNHAPVASGSPSAPARTSPVPIPPAPTQPPPGPAPIRRQYGGEPADEELRRNAIPPLYNEAWNIRPAPSSA